MAYYLSEINERCKKDPAAFIADCDALYAARLEQAADRILENRSRSPIVLLSGPSGSGKTTTSMKIAEVLERKGVRTHYIAMDDYFLDVSPETTPRLPDGGFPEELGGIAGSAFGDAPIPDLRNRLAAGVLNRLMACSENPASPEIFEKYRSRSLAPGRAIRILRPGEDPVPAVALDLEPDYALRVRLENGVEQILRSGEISIRLEPPMD